MRPNNAAGNTFIIAGRAASKYEKGILDGVLFPILNESLGFYYGDEFYGKTYADKVSKYHREGGATGTASKAAEQNYKDVIGNNTSTQTQKEQAHKAMHEAKDADRRTVARFVVDTCDFCCDTLDLISKGISVGSEIAKMVNEENWFERKGLVGKNHAQDIKYLFASLKYTLNTIAIHAVVMANTWGVKPAKVALSGGELAISTTSGTTVNATQITARSLL